MEQASVLIVEDDPTLLRGLRDNFRFKGYRVSDAADGRAGLEAALEGKPDLIVLDIMLPEMDGYEVCKRVRDAGLDMPVIMLTAKGREEDVIRGLNAGAHDYMTKPFSVKELMARAHNLLKRSRGALPDVFQFGECEVNLVSHKLYRNGEEVALTPKEFGLLTHFIRNAGRALTRDEIMDSVWGSDILVTPRSVDRCINTLRHKVEPTPPKPIYIQTIRDIGYRFEVPDCEDEVATGPAKKASPWHDGQSVGGFQLQGLVDGPACGGRWLAHAREDGEPVILQRLDWLGERGSRILKEQLARLETVSAKLPCGAQLLEHDGLSFLVYRHTGQKNLRQLLDSGPMEPEQAISLGVSLANCLHAAHKQEVFHLGLTPDLVWIDGNNHRLLGFGLAPALFAEFDNAFGPWNYLDPAYQSPQRLRGEDATVRDDVFGLGCLLYEMVAGKAPFAAANAAESLARAMMVEPEDLTRRGLSKQLWRVVAHCLEKDADDRFQTMRDLSFALDGLL